MTGLRPGDTPDTTDAAAEMERQANRLYARANDIDPGIAADTYRAADRMLRHRAAELRQDTPATAPGPVEVAAAELEALATRAYAAAEECNYREETTYRSDATCGSEFLSGIRAFAERAEARAAELRQDTPAGPAEEWETITADQIRPGDHLQMRESGPGWEQTWRGRVVDVQASSGAGWLILGRGEPEPRGRTVYLDGRPTLTRRVRQPMPEPEAPSVVRHAGRMIARPDWSQTGHAGASDGGPHWVLMSGKPYGGRTAREVWLTWPQVLALDPDTDPEVLDLGEV